MITQTWKHKETNEVIDHLTYQDLPASHKADFEDANAETSDTAFNIDDIPKTVEEIIKAEDALEK